MPQILQNYKQGHTGQLSLLSLSLTLLGGLARFFTVMQQVPDGFVLVCHHAPADAVDVASTAAVWVCTAS